MRIKKELSTLFLVTSGFLVSSPAMAVASCWDVPDFVGCAIQCAVMGNGNSPCPVDAVNMDVNLPDVQSDEYQKVKQSIYSQVNRRGFGDKRDGIINSSLKQSCSSNEMLEVVGKIGLANPDALVEKCFVKVK